MSYYTDVCEFMDAVKQDRRFSPGINHESKALRIRLHDEEMGELQAAMERDDLIEIADGIADVIVVVAGTAAAYGIDLDAVFAEVHRSNMSKVADGLKDEGGKIIKGPNYSPPDIAGVLGR